MENAHAPYFSSLRWRRFVQNRPVPESAVSFAEIEVPLCNIPSREDWLADLERERREREGILTLYSEYIMVYQPVCQAYEFVRASHIKNICLQAEWILYL